MSDTSVKYFTSTMSGAPALSGTAGTLIALLDACLVNGFGSVTVNSIVIAAGVVTVTVSTGHGFAMSGATGPVILINGATPAALNAEWRVESITSTTVFTFSCPGIADGEASGTITAKRAPAGWEKRYSGTNKAAYARLAADATAMLLRVNDTPTQYPEFLMYEAMTDVDTGTNSSGVTQYAYKSSLVSTLVRPWRVVADGRCFWLFTDPAGDGSWSLTGFGDLVNYRVNDLYSCFLRGSTTANANIAALYAYSMASQSNCRLMRALSGNAAPIYSNMYSHVRNGANHGYGVQAMPATADGRLHAWPIEAWDETTSARGLVPGIMNPVHALPGSVDGTVYPGSAGRDWLMQKVGNTNNYGVLLDLTGPWR